MKYPDRDTVETHLALHIFLRILNKMRRIEQRKFVVWKAESRDVVTIGSIQAKTRAGGQHSINIDLDEEHASLAPFLAGFLLHKVKHISPEHTVQTGLWKWEATMLDIYQEVGFKIR